MDTFEDNRDYQRELIDRLVSKVGLRGKIDAKCIECIYDPYADGTWRQQVAGCTSKTCPLHTSRAKPSKQ